ncbi:MAG: hypothetical protein ABL876_07895 [Chitinophagaceae bacterium]
MNSQFEETFSEEFFPVELLIYKKGDPCYITAQGMAEKLWIKGANSVCVTINTIEMQHTKKTEYGFLKSLLRNTGKFMGIL